MTFAEYFFYSFDVNFTFEAILGGVSLIFATRNNRPSKLQSS